MPTLQNALYKQRQEHYKMRRRMVRRFGPRNDGDKVWCSKGQGYVRKPDGSLRRINDPAPVGMVQRIKGLFAR